MGQIWVWLSGPFDFVRCLLYLLLFCMLHGSFCCDIWTRLIENHNIVSALINCLGCLYYVRS